MEPIADMIVRSDGARGETEETGEESYQFGEEIQRMMLTAPPENGSSFTALLELPANQAMELLHSSELAEAPAVLDHHKPHNNSMSFSLTCPSNAALGERAARFSIFAAGGEDSPETSSMPENSSANSHRVKSEPTDTESNPNSSTPLLSNPTVHNNSQRPTKRKEREKKTKGSTKKGKNATNESSEDAEKLPYVHVRARRGQATDSHSLAERARREKINARMKLLQELVPGCNKISGTAMVLDEIINHVQSLQHQVEFLSMRLAAVNPRVDSNLDGLLASEGASQMDSNFPNVPMSFMWPDVLFNGNRQQYQQLWHIDALNQPAWGRGEDNHFVTPETSLLSYDSSANSMSLHSNS